MAETVSFSELVKGYSVLIGGIDTVPYRSFSDTENKAFNLFIDNAVKTLRKISPDIAADFEEQVSLFKVMGEIFCAKVDKTFGGMMPHPNEVGCSLLIPQDIKYAASADSDNPCFTDYTANTWNINVSSLGSPVYIFGSATDFYKARPEIGKRCLFIVMKNGILEVETEPSFNQFNVTTEKVNFPWQVLNPLVDQPIEKDKAIYRYDIPFAIPVWYDFGVKLAMLPSYGPTGTKNVRLIGVIFYEYGHRSSYLYVT